MVLCLRQFLWWADKNEALEAPTFATIEPCLDNMLEYKMFSNLYIVSLFVFVTMCTTNLQCTLTADAKLLWLHRPREVVVYSRQLFSTK